LLGGAFGNLLFIDSSFFSLLAIFSAAFAASYGMLGEMTCLIFPQLLDDIMWGMFSVLHKF
jgi:hypothetical protein